MTPRGTWNRAQPKGESIFFRFFLGQIYDFTGNLESGTTLRRKHILKKKIFFFKLMIPRGTWNRAQPRGDSIFV